jgi:hypothetical protein
MGVIESSAMSDERIAATLFAILYEDLTSLSDPRALIYRRRSHDVWQPLGGGLPEPLPAMPYALVAADGLLFADLADGQIWASDDRGDNWTHTATELRHDPGARSSRQGHGRPSGQTWSELSRNEAPSAAGRRSPT